MLHEHISNQHNCAQQIRRDRMAEPGFMQHNRLETFTTVNALMVLNAISREGRKMSILEWRQIYDVTLRLISDLKTHPPLDEIEALAASIIIIGCEYDSLFIAAFHLLQPWQKIRGWFWVLALELLRHHALMTMRNLRANDSVTFIAFHKEMITLLDMVPSIPETQKQLLLADIQFQQKNGFTHELLDEYAQKYPLEKFCSWSVKKLQAKLHGMLVFLSDGEGKIVSLTNTIKPKRLQLSSEEVIPDTTDVHSHNALAPSLRKQRKRGNEACIDKWPPMRPFQGECSWSEEEESDTTNIKQESDKENDNPQEKENCNTINLLAADVGKELQSLGTKKRSCETAVNETDPADENVIKMSGKKKKKIRANQSTHEEGQMLIFTEQNNAEISDISVCSEDKRVNTNSKHQIQHECNEAKIRDDKGCDRISDNELNSDCSFQEDTSLVSRLKMAVWKVFNID